MTQKTTSIAAFLAFLLALVGVALTQDAVNFNRAQPLARTINANYPPHRLVHFEKRARALPAVPLFALPPPQPAHTIEYNLGANSPVMYTPTQDQSLWRSPYLSVFVDRSYEQLPEVELANSEEIKPRFGNFLDAKQSQDSNNKRMSKLMSDEVAVNTDNDDESISLAKSAEELRKPINLSTRSGDLPLHPTLTGEFIQNYFYGRKPTLVSQLNKKAETKPHKDNFFMHFG